jgi:excisionase family DNA binding protein
METDSQIETASGTQQAEAERSQGLLTKYNLAQRLQLSVRTVDTWMRAGRLPYLKVGEKTVRFRWPDVVEKLKTYRVN